LLARRDPDLRDGPLDAFAAVALRDFRFGDLDRLAGAHVQQVTSFIPFTKVLPKVGVFITNGGFGAVNQALSMVVPIVIAGETEDKRFVAARVAWSGAGINLGTNRPGPEQVRDAVCEVLRDGRHRDNARRLQKDFAQYDALGRIAGYIERLGRSGFRPSHVQKAGADLLQ
jgi:UDP:flavonoid glycosyltransferase YjiC (YdhE family)